MISCSIGISTAPENGDNFASIYKMPMRPLSGKEAGEKTDMLSMRRLEDVIQPETRLMWLKRR